MIDKVQKIREEVARIQLYTQSEVLKQVLDYIDEVQKKPVSEDLEEEIDNYVKRNGYDGLDSTEEIKYIANHFANWQKEKMMAKTIETTFNVSLPSGLYDKLWIKGCKDGDKLLVIKKDEL